MSGVPTEVQGGDRPASKACPFCGESILETAVKCKHCGEFLDEAARPSESSKPVPVGRIITIVILVVAVLAGLAWIYIGSGIGANIDARCQINGFGVGTCEFTNNGWSPGQDCVTVGLRSRSYDLVTSTPVCSGSVWPGQANERKAYVDVPKGHCKGDFMNGETWTDVCDLVVEAAP